MEQFNQKVLKQLYRPPKDSHKGQNGKLLVIGGSNLFHSASMWSLEVASRIVDMVFYSSVPVNEAIVKKQKERFQNGIIVPRGKIDEYINESDCILIGPGMERGQETKEKTNQLLKRHQNKKWVIDGGALQVMDKNLLNKNMIITPHHQEYKLLFGEEKIEVMAKKHKCTIVLKGREDVICNSKQCLINQTGNEGMTKGGTGDVLAGLIAALYCKNEAFLAASCGTYLNGLAGDRLYAKIGPYFNTSDLVREIPRVMGEVIS
ncbi:MAG: NAD(P)H-hydrate dehydratase [Candidatus Beckwithbacteria bacterium]|nr:NAD(P)H-hydrate dehydratase [Candidatus Beckwithbacteria bacterium]